MPLPLWSMRLCVMVTMADCNNNGNFTQPWPYLTADAAAVFGV
jgi:hypothetical protein